MCKCGYREVDLYSEIELRDRFHCILIILPIPNMKCDLPFSENSFDVCARFWNN